MLAVREVIKFFIYVFLQVFVFRDLILFGYAMCFIYIAYIITLPLNIGRAYLLLIGFFFGFIIDIFYNTGGIHTFSTTFIAYIRPFLITRFLSEGTIKKTTPLVNLNGFKLNQIVVYVLIVIFIHHILVLFIQTSSFHLFFYTFAKVLLSSLFTFILFITGHYLFLKSSS